MLGRESAVGGETLHLGLLGALPHPDLQGPVGLGADIRFSDLLGCTKTIELIPDLDKEGFGGFLF